MSQPPVEHEWWKEFHEPEMADLFLARSDKTELEETVHFLIEALQLKAGNLVYDQCCGIGSLSIGLARRGVCVVGADLTEHFIDRARRDAAQAQADCEFHCADAFDFVPQRACHGVFNWYSSFGYSRSDERNHHMLRRAFEALQPGGRIALDVPNLTGLLRDFQRQLVRQGQIQGRDVVLIRESTVNLREGLLEQVWTWRADGQPSRERRSALRLYLPHQIAQMLSACGFAEIRLWGSVRGEELALDSPRLVCTARRPLS